MYRNLLTAVELKLLLQYFAGSSLAVSAQATHSWIKLTEDGAILAAHCDCKAGQGIRLFFSQFDDYNTNVLFSFLLVFYNYMVETNFFMYLSSLNNM